MSALLFALAWLVAILLVCLANYLFRVPKEEGE